MLGREYYTANLGAGTIPCAITITTTTTPIEPLIPVTEYSSLPKILVVRPDIPDGYPVTHSKKLAAKNGFSLVIIPSYAELYKTLADTTQNVAMVGLNLTSISEEGADIWSIIHTCDMILKANNSDTIFIAGATSKTPTRLIKQFLSMNERCVGIYPTGDEFTDDEKTLAFSHFKTKTHHIPEKIRNILAPKKDTNGNIKLTPRQEQILNMIVTRGSSNKMIARSLGITESTVKLHVAKLLQKFCARNRTQLAVSCQNKV